MAKDLRNIYRQTMEKPRETWEEGINFAPVPTTCQAQSCASLSAKGFRFAPVKANGEPLTRERLGVEAR
jgi:hypothetical protein